MSKDTMTKGRVTIVRTRHIDITDTSAERTLDEAFPGLDADLRVAVLHGAITLRRARELAALRAEGNLWVSYGGELSCTAHLGHQASAALAANPAATSLYGATEPWHRMTADEADDFEAYVGRLATCERCGAGR